MSEHTFMAWIDHLHEVGDPIRRERSKLYELVEQANELERHAAALLVKARAGQAELLSAVMKRWSLAEIQSAAQAADRMDPAALARAQLDDPCLQQALAPLDGWHLASDALRAFEAGVIRQHNLLSTATDDERKQTLARLVVWWNHAGRPVWERLAA